MRDQDDTPMSDEEMDLAKKGEALISSAVADTHAPQSLRESIERQRQRAQSASRPSFWRRHGRTLAAAAATTTVVLFALLVAFRPQSDSPEPTLADVEAAAALQASEPAPAPAGGDPPVLAAGVDPIRFPDWRKSFGWRAVGSREDEVAGRTVSTVFYRNSDGARLGYSIVAGAPLEGDPPGRPVTREGDTYHVAEAAGHTLITWTQQGHTCSFVASAGVPEAKLLELAASRNA